MAWPFNFFCGFPKLTCNRVIWFHVTEQETQLFLSVLAERDGTSKPQSQKKYVKHVFFPSNWDTFFFDRRSPIALSGIEIGKYAISRM